LRGHDFTAQRVDWGKRLTGSPRELLNAEKQSAQALAETFLRDFLAVGPRSQPDVKAAAEAHCHSWPTIRRAQQRLGIKPQKQGKAWVWWLPITNEHLPER